VPGRNAAVTKKPAAKKRIAKASAAKKSVGKTSVKKASARKAVAKTTAAKKRVAKASTKTRVVRKVGAAKVATKVVKVAKLVAAKTPVATEAAVPPKSSAQHRRLNAARIKANVEKRQARHNAPDAAKATKAATLVRDLSGAVAAPDDEAAQDALDRANPSARIKRSATERLDDPPPATGLVLIERVGRAVERELILIEKVVGGHHVKKVQRTEAERRTRTLASLARTLADLRKLRAEEQRNRPDDDAIPRDLDELRRALSRRLEQMVGRSEELPAAGDE
jgi:hypothetical protein